MSDTQNSDAQTTEGEQGPKERSCVFSVASILLALGAIVLFIFVLLHASDFYSAGDDIVYFLIASVLPAIVSAVVAISREEPCAALAKIALVPSVPLLFLLLPLLPRHPPPQVKIASPPPDVTFGSSITPMDHDPSDTFVPHVYVNGNWLGSAGTGAAL